MDKYIISKKEYKNKFNNNNITSKEKVLEVYKERNRNMKDLIIFNNKEFGRIRSIEIEGETYLAGIDVAKALGYKNTKDAIKTHVNEKDKRLIQRSEITPFENHIPKSVFPVEFVSTEIPNRGLIFINESGVYSLIMGSKLPDAKKFKHWVTSEVLPQINKTGSYNNSNDKLFAKLTECQIETSYNLVGIKRQLDETSSIISEHDKLLKERVYVSPKEAKDIQNAMKERAKIIAIDNDLPYHKVKGCLFKRLYTDLNETFEVATYRELPSYKFMDILETISKLNVYTADLQCVCSQISL